MKGMNKTMTRIAYDEESKSEIADDGGYEVLHIYGFPDDIVPAVNKYNREHPGPNGNAINITQTCIDVLRKELKKREHPLQSLTHNPNVGPVELRRAADLIRGLGYRPPEDIDGNRLKVGDMVGFTIAGPDANNYLQGTVCLVDGAHCVYCGTPGSFRINNDLLNLHMLPDDEPGLRGRECHTIVVDEGIGTGDAESDVRAQTRGEIVCTARSIWLCPVCVTAITNQEYVHLNLKGCCEDCDSPLEQYEKVNWRS